MTTATNNVARIAAAVAGFGLVAMSFAPLANAQTTTTTTTTTTASATFTRNLTIGSTGADVTALQTWLIGKGFTIAAGATGYFGAQTKAALASYQASKSITPAAGYFGPITRAAVAADGGSTSTTGLPAGCTSTAGYSPTTGVSCSSSASTGDLKGGEASFRSFTLVSGDSVMAGDTGTEIAVAKFDVKNGDANLQRVTVEMQASSASYSEKPWDYIQTLSVYNGSKKIGSVDVGSKSDWSKVNDDSSHAGSVSFYSVDVPVSSTVRQDDKVELSIRADAQGTIDTTDLSQTFYTDVPTDGIRAVDSKGIQQYTGSTSSTVTTTFDNQLSGNLVVTKASDSPAAGVLVADSTKTTTGFDLLSFSIKNKDNADTLVNSLKFSIATSSASGSSAANITNIVRKATLDLDGTTYTGTVQSGNTIFFDNMDATIGADSTVDGVLTVDLYSQTGHYAATGESLTATLTGSTTYVDAEGVDSGDAATVSGSAVGNQQTVVTDAGINVAGGTNNAVLTYNSTDTTKSYGTYTLKFDVTASGDNVYVPKQVASSTASTTAGVVVNTNLNNTFAGTSTVSMSSTADTDATGPSYIVRDGETKTFTITYTLDPSATGTFSIGLDQVRYSTAAALSSLQTLEVDQTKSEFHTDALSIQN